MRTGAGQIMSSRRERPANGDVEIDGAEEPPERGGLGKKVNETALGIARNAGHVDGDDKIWTRTEDAMTIEYVEETRNEDCQRSIKLLKVT